MINITICMRILLLVMIGVPPTPIQHSSHTRHGGITYYYNQFEGRNLKCPGYQYERETGPWLAVDISQYESGKTLCGDWYLVLFYDGSIQSARALDSGYLSRYRVWDTNLPFVADLPRYWRDGRETRTGTIVNMSALLREAGVE